MSGFILGTKKAWAYFEQKTSLSVSTQTFISAGLGAAHSITSAAAPETITGGDCVSLCCMKQAVGKAQMLKWS